MTLQQPAIFVGHGSPMNAIEENEFSRTWEKIGMQLPKPKAILSVSAHWYTHGTKILNVAQPKMIYDMYGFPEELYKVTYPSKGSIELAKKTFDLTTPKSTLDTSWGIDHGTWSVLKWMYPNADIPVFQMSVDMDASMKDHFKLGNRLKQLREEGVMILGSGNVVHNLGAVDWDMKGGYIWADEFDLYIKENVLAKNFANVIDYKNAGSSAMKAFPMPDHFAPLLYCLGSMYTDDKITVFNEKRVMGGLSMTGYILGSGL